MLVFSIEQAPVCGGEVGEFVIFRDIAFADAQYAQQDGGQRARAVASGRAVEVNGFVIPQAVDDKSETGRCFSRIVLYHVVVSGFKYRREEGDAASQRRLAGGHAFFPKVNLCFDAEGEHLVAAGIAQITAVQATAPVEFAVGDLLAAEPCPSAQVAAVAHLGLEVNLVQAALG